MSDADIQLVHRNASMRFRCGCGVNHDLNTWKRTIMCGCGKFYRRYDHLPMASQADLDHLFGIPPILYDNFGSFG